ncbi:exocyst subunit EXO84 KNAG_0J02550 [Huiozyma naganishii CBS 8797]|uniref:Exocyst complex component EXO84 n=1 Tax=Huiozyma naganishii (strain ATCC MYA-139 / BCRC 22969 / CBS 8797 / KCTC 17520 / NBRC 10181 / NCYC 3082 / Yp74L-3) TaxID=1071383 RepID=J7S9W4_HUIN7|nr:hypothetical protein KNAG_0J02550 [Kazachstania naganishii CBS 8797]CCK72334.1 hypothetical protein KNAG_0J02550 [Kazachstania naganishii CBS 8797]
MVDFSLKKARNNWRNVKIGSPTKVKHVSGSGVPPTGSQSLASGTPVHTPEATPPAEPRKLTVPQQKGHLPTVHAHEKNKAASSMQRRLSVYAAGHAAPTFDYSMPLPTAKGPREMAGTSATGPPASQEPQQGRLSIREITQPAKLRSLLTDTHFNAKAFVHENLRDASALDIDSFTTTLADLSQSIQVEVKENINRSYREIMQVNADLHTASVELDTLRGNIEAMNSIMGDFKQIADKRLALETARLNESMPASAASDSRGADSLLPRLQVQEEIRSSVYILGNMRSQQLSEMEREIEGASKVLRGKNRYLVTKSKDLAELNITTLRYLQVVRFYILNDAILIARKNETNDYILNQTLSLRETTVNKEPGTDNRFVFKVNSNNSLLYETRDPQECEKILNSIRKAKDDLCDIYESDKMQRRKMKESVRYLQSTQQTPVRDSSVTRSPVKSYRRSTGGSAPMTPGGRHSVGYFAGAPQLDSAADQYLLQSAAYSSMSSKRGGGQTTVASNRLKMLNDYIEEVDINIARFKMRDAVDILLDIESQLSKLSTEEQLGDATFCQILDIKLRERRESLSSKLSQNILFSDDVTHLIQSVEALIKLGYADEGLDLFLQNRSNAIQELILQIGSFDNPTNYLTQLSVIRFQTIKRTVLNYEEFFAAETEAARTAKKKLSSILVNWCNSEVDRHFQLIDEQLLNDEMLSPVSIKSSRRQIDDLKSVGLDFVYKLDEFIRINSDRIG